MTTEIGCVVRLQVQTGSLKRGERPHRVYDPRALAEAPLLRISPRGPAGELDGEIILDVHHVDHPASKSEPGREASFGFTSHYAKMRQTYGEHLATGCAGENVLVESERVWLLEDLAAGLAFQSRDSGAILPLSRVSVADPCAHRLLQRIRADPLPPAN